MSFDEKAFREQQGRDSREILKLRKREEAVLAAFQKTVTVGSRVKHQADGALLTVISNPSTHPMYDLDVLGSGGDVSPVYLRNLLPEWWPWPY